jgi:hypothetical protein
MIDFVSTRQTTDAQTAACARLLAAVIAQAIKDACKPMTADEKRKEKNLDSEARQAIQFLFGTDSVFPLYASLIGSSAESIRFALLNKAEDMVQVASRSFSDMDRRVLKGRMRWRGEFMQPNAKAEPAPTARKKDDGQ